MVRSTKSGPLRVIGPGPALADVGNVAERVKGFVPAWRRGVEGFAGGELHPGDDKVQFVVSGMGMAHPQNIELVWLQPGKGHFFKVIHDALFLLRCHLVIRMP